MQDFRKLRVWQENRELTKAIYSITSVFPSTERYGLAAQMRSAAISIGANIAEGCGRGTRPDTIRFLYFAFGSAVELLHHLISALDLGFLTQTQFDQLEAQLELIRKMLSAFIQKMRLG